MTERAVVALDALTRRLAASPGLLGKADVAEAVAALDVGGDGPTPVGDDCAALPRPGGGWSLLACEGMIEEFVEAMPWFAGWSAVMVNLSDVAAMGGRSVAVVNAIWAEAPAKARPILDGMAAACAAYGAPMVGGHANFRARAGQLSVSVLGEARALMTSFAARPGDALVMAADLRGRWRDPYPFWDAATDAPAERLRAAMALLPAIAEAGLAHACKDISQGGVVGTAAMLLECSRVGAEIDVDAAPIPAGAPLERWLTAFPSFGYLLAAAPDRVPALVDAFEGAGVAAARIGTIDASGLLRIRRGEATATLRDVARAPLLGCAPRRAPPTAEWMASNA